MLRNRNSRADPTLLSAAWPSPPPPLNAPPRLRVRLALAGVATLLAIVVVIVSVAGGGGPPVTPPPPIHPNRPGPLTMFTAGNVATDSPAMLDELKGLGVNSVHVYMHWADIAPDPTSRTRPDFDATDPAAYPAAAWAPFDAVVRGLAARHMGIDLDLVPPPPLLGFGQGRAQDPARRNPSGSRARRSSDSSCAPSAPATAATTSRRVNPSRCPRVVFWSIWNEPNLGIELAPEAIDHSEVEVSARLYRALVDAAWSAFAATGHGHDTILIGEMAPGRSRARSRARQLQRHAPAAVSCARCTASTPPINPLRGAAARSRGCPATAAGSAQFAAANPGLFHASGLRRSPISAGPSAQQGHARRTGLRRAGGDRKARADAWTPLQRAYGSNTRFPIWSTEFGYQTTPPDPEAGTVTPTIAAYYLNWSEYLTWLDPRIRSYDQYLLGDPPGGGFATGLVTAAGVPKPGYYAFRMPLYLPVTETPTGHPLDVWGCVRPAPSAARTTHTPPARPDPVPGRRRGIVSHRPTVAIGGPHCYFDVRQTFPGTGEVRLAWAPPHGADGVQPHCRRDASLG